MTFLPIENITYKTKLNREEILRKLSDSIMSENIFRINSVSNNLKPYEGKFDKHSFKIRRVIKYRNSFLPQIIGNINEELNITTVRIKMRIHIFVIIFLCVWFSLAVFFSFLAFGNINSEESNIVSFMPFGMLAFGYILTMGCFKYESKKAKEDLLNMFEAKIEKETCAKSRL